MNAVQIFHQWAPLGTQDLSATPRQLEEVTDFLNGLVPDAPLDAPTVMALILVFAFIVQFYWTLISASLAETSSLDTTTTTTTTTTTAASRVLVTKAASSRTQTVTPAPAPSWRHFLNDFGLPHWVKKRSADIQNSGIQYQQSEGRAISNAAIALGIKNRQARRRLSYDEVTQMWETLPVMDLKYESSDEEEEPIELSSHRLVNLPQVEFTKDTSQVASNMLHAAQQWGDRLQQWHVISPEGGQLVHQTILMMRCAVGGVAYCAKLDHHFRRQHDLNLAAAMMNYPYEDSTTGDVHYGLGSHDPHEQWHPDVPDRAWPDTDRGPGRVYDNNAIPAAVYLDDGINKVRAQRRQSQAQADEPSQKEGEDREDTNNKVSSSGSVGKSSWNLYFFMSVMAVLVFLMDASYRILRVVSSSTGRALHDPHEDVLTALTAAIRRWEVINSPLQTS